MACSRNSKVAWDWNWNWNYNYDSYTYDEVSNMVNSRKSIEIDASLLPAIKAWRDHPKGAISQDFLHQLKLYQFRVENPSQYQQLLARANTPVQVQAADTLGVIGRYISSFFNRNPQHHLNTSAAADNALPLSQQVKR